MQSPLNRAPGASPRRMATLLLTVQTLAVGECYKLPVGAYFKGMKKLKLSALAYGLTTAESVPCRQ